jgi:two-component system KDP operon response regulator KdpE
MRMRRQWGCRRANHAFITDVTLSLWWVRARLCGTVVSSGMRTSDRVILVVDDEPALRTVLRRLLSRAGYRVLEAADGEEGLALAARERVDAVLLDLCMPGIQGNQVLRELRVSAPTLPVIIVSATLDDAVKAMLLEAGAAACLDKPAEPEALLAALREVLDG